MDSGLKLLMTETSKELCRLCQSTLAPQGIQVTVCPRNGVVAYSDLLTLKPDAILLDVFMPGMDAISLKNKFDNSSATFKTAFFATGTFQNDEIEKEIIQNGFLFYFLKPFDVGVLAQRILKAANPETTPHQPRHFNTTDEDMISDMLRSIGVPAHIMGYRYLRDAILLVMNDPKMMNSVTKSLYPTVATQNDTIASRVERAIRHAIEVAWDRGDLEILHQYFGSTVHGLRGKPTNSEFIALLADKAVAARRQRA